jgi:hypothetical protein
VAYRVFADALVALHVAFIAFVVFGGFAVLRWPRLAALHMPAVAWAAFVEFTGTICPLTPWENVLRLRAGDAGFAGSFVEHYVHPLLYPAGLTPPTQATLGTFVVALNVLIYGAVLWQRGRRT